MNPDDTMDCPVCKDTDAYVGLNSVDCLNPECPNFKEAYLETKLAEQQKAFDELLDRLDIRNEWDDVLEAMWFRITAGTLGLPREITNLPGDTKCNHDS